MKLLSSIILIIGFAAVLIACGGAETKVDPIIEVDTSANVEPAAPVTTEEKKPVTEPRSTAVDSPVNAERHEILRNIDRHLVTTQSASDRLTVENKLPDVDFQRVIIEVSELDNNGTPTRTNFYQVTNLDAGTTKTAKITAPAAGVKLDIHIVKAKSTELTKGEMILVGSRYNPVN